MYISNSINLCNKISEHKCFIFPNLQPLKSSLKFVENQNTYSDIYLILSFMYICIYMYIMYMYVYVYDIYSRWIIDTKLLRIAHTIPKGNFFNNSLRFYRWYIRHTQCEEKKKKYCSLICLLPLQRNSDLLSTTVGLLSLTSTTLKVSKYRVFSGLKFPVFGPEKNLDTFHAVFC